MEAHYRFSMSFYQLNVFIYYFYYFLVGMSLAGTSGFITTYHVYVGCDAHWGPPSIASMQVGGGGTRRASTPCLTLCAYDVTLTPCADVVFSTCDHHKEVFWCQFSSVICRSGAGARSMTLAVICSQLAL